MPQWMQPDACIAAAETCDYKDDDCDGQVDEGYSAGGHAMAPMATRVRKGSSCAFARGRLQRHVRQLRREVQRPRRRLRGGSRRYVPVGQACSVGLGACLRSGQPICNTSADRYGVQRGRRNAGVPRLAATASTRTAMAPIADVRRERLAGRRDGSLTNGGTFTVDLVAAHDDNWAASTATLDCGDQGGRDAFYQFTLPAEEVVYFDTFASNSTRWSGCFAGRASRSVRRKHAPTTHARPRARKARSISLAGTYCLVIDQYAPTTTAGAASLTFKRGGARGHRVTGSERHGQRHDHGQTNLSIAGCEANSAQPDVALLLPDLPEHDAHASVRARAAAPAFDTVIYLRTGAATSRRCRVSDDVSGCGNNFQS